MRFTAEAQKLKGKYTVNYVYIHTFLSSTYMASGRLGPRSNRIASPGLQSVENQRRRRNKRKTENSTHYVQAIWIPFG